MRTALKMHSPAGERWKPGRTAKRPRQGETGGRFNRINGARSLSLRGTHDEVTP